MLYIVLNNYKIYCCVGYEFLIGNYFEGYFE